MRHRLLRPVLIALALVIVAAAVVVGVRWWRGADGTELQQAMALAPANGQRFAWTDWADVRRQLADDPDADPDGVLDDLGADSDAAAVQALLDAGFNADLSTASGIVDSSVVLQDDYGFSPASVQWELLTQSKDGAVITLRLPESTDFDQIRDNLSALGYQRPEKETEVWVGSDEIPSAAGVSPEFAHVALDAEERLVRASDTQKYLASVASEDVALGPKALEPIVEELEEPASALLTSGSYVCSALAMSQADPTDQEEGARLLEEAGEIHPILGYAIALSSSTRMLVVMSFENQDQARTNADSRSQLARGPAPGQGGSFAERFEVGKVAAQDGLLTMLLTPVEGAYAFSDLSAGPLLFATC